MDRIRNVLSLEDKIIEKECQNFFGRNEIIYTQIPSNIAVGCKIISSIYNELDSKIENPFAMSHTYLLNLYETNRNVFEMVMNKKFYYSDEFTRNFEECNLEKIKFKIEETHNLFNILLEEYYFSKDETAYFLGLFFLQSFVDSFNEIYNNGPMIDFLSKKDLRKASMKKGLHWIVDLTQNENFLLGINSDETFLLARETVDFREYFIKIIEEGN